MRTKIFILLFLVFYGLGCSKPTSDQKTDLKLVPFDGDFFSINIPEKWQLTTAGLCSNFAFLLSDSEKPLRQAFYFSTIGPVYTNEQQKTIDYQYMNAGGYPIAWNEMPAVNPLTPSNFLKQFHRIANTQIAQQFMPQCPKLEQLHIVSSKKQPCPLGSGRGETELIRAIFFQNKKVCEGLFLVTVAPYMPFTGNPGSGTAYGLMFTGISAEKSDFKSIENSLGRSLGSFAIKNEYASTCTSQTEAVYAGINKAGNTLRETSDMIMDGWNKRNKIHDILAEKKSDTILEKERLYSERTDKVYEFDSGFYGDYKLDKNRYKLNDLKPLPDSNYEMWMRNTLEGYQHLNESN